jgi:hypothetical protein
MNYILILNLLMLALKNVSKKVLGKTAEKHANTKILKIGKLF